MSQSNYPVMRQDEDFFEYPDTENPQSFESDAAALVKAANIALKKLEYGSLEYKNLLEAAANLEAWFEDSDPRSMGWVDSRGRP